MKLRRRTRSAKLQSMREELDAMQPVEDMNHRILLVSRPFIGPPPPLPDNLPRSTLVIYLMEESINPEFKM